MQIYFDVRGVKPWGVNGYTWWPKNKPFSDLSLKKRIYEAKIFSSNMRVKETHNISSWY